MADWKVLGDAKEGVLTLGTKAYPYVIEEGQVRVRLPFVVDRDRLQAILEADGWAVDPNENRVDSQAWGPDHDEDGYYPCWVWPDRETNQTILAFPPRDYQATVQGAGPEPMVDHDPIFGTQALAEFVQWIGPVEQAAEGSHLGLS